MNSKSTTGFPMSCAYVTPKFPKRWLKKRFFVFNEIQFQSNKVCKKVSLCEKFQRQSSSVAIPHLTVHKYWRET